MPKHKIAITFKRDYTFRHGMGQLVKKTVSIEQTKEDILKELKNTKSLSGEQILDALILMADEADRQFTPNLLKNFWKPFEGHYTRFIRDISASFGLNERPLYDAHEPFSGYNKQLILKKENLTRLIPHLQMVNSSLLDKIEDNDEMLLVSYHIWHSMGSSSSYFHSAAVSRLHEIYLRLKGMREESEVNNEVISLLKPNQLNSSETPLEILICNNPSDLFEYKQRLYTLQQKIDNYQKNAGSLVSLIWALGVYTLKWPKLIGYILCNEQLKNKKGLFLPSHE